MRLLVLFLFATVSLAAGVACSSGSSATSTPGGIRLGEPSANPTSTPVAIVTSFEGEVEEFELHLAYNGSPQTGTAVFTRMNDYAVVSIRLRPGVPAQSVTLRHGRCPEPGGFIRTLNLAIGGVMRQELRNTPFDDLLKGDMTLVVTANDDEFNTFAVCGDFPLVE